MASFIIDGVKLRVPGRALTAPLRSEMERGHYEWNEAIAVKRHVTPKDRVLDIGAGAGFLSVLSARQAGAENVVAVEANPVMLTALRQNLDHNNCEAVELVHGAVVADHFDETNVLFAARDAFWSSGLADETTPADKVHEVPALHLSELFETYRPTVVSIDVEGGELELCQQKWPRFIRLVVLEIHTGRYPPSGVKAIIDGMSANNMTLMPWGTRGEVIVFQRVDE